MKKNLLLAAFAFVFIARVVAQTVTVTPSASTYNASGGQITFTVNLSYPANVSAVGFAAKPPTATWAHVSTGGTNIPGLNPAVGETTDPASASSELGWTYPEEVGPPASGASFTFVLSYPAGLSGNQTFAFSGHTRLAGVRTDISVPSVTISPPIAPAITTQPANVSVASGANATFTVAASGTPTPSFKWQRSTDNGSTFSDLSNDGTYGGVTTATLTVTAVTSALNGYRFRAIASNTAATTATSNAAILTVLFPPIITTQPSAQPVLAGTSATFTVAAAGSGTLTYQWYFTPAGSSTPQALANIAGKIAGAQTPSLTVSNAQTSDAGDYVCIVGGSVNPSATSNAAQLTIVPRLVRVTSLTAAPGANIVVPVQLIASGSENTVSFSLQFDPTKLTYVSHTIGADAVGGTLTPNTSQKDSGKVSYLIGKQPGEVYTAGTRTILNITFTVNATAADGASLALSFTDTPTARRIIAADSSVLPGSFVDGEVKVVVGIEGDLNGDGQVDASDWVKLGRIVVGLDAQPTGTNFMKADCAPRSNKGDGAVDAGDWVQLGRYVVGLDVTQSAGGPSTPTP